MLTVFYDACVLYPAPLRDLLVRLALTGHIRARWSAAVLDECFRAIRRRRPDIDESRLRRTRMLMEQAIPDVEVTGYEPLVSGIDLPDPDDRHVVAAAWHVGANVIVTANESDFPAHVLRPLGLETRLPDRFVTELIERAPASVLEVVVTQAAALRDPPRTPSELLDTLERQGLRQAVARLRGYLADDARRDR